MAPVPYHSLKKATRIIISVRKDNLYKSLTNLLHKEISSITLIAKKDWYSNSDDQIKAAPLIIVEYENQFSLDQLKLVQKTNKVLLFVGPNIGEMAAIDCIKNGAENYIPYNKLHLLPMIVKDVLSKESNNYKQKLFRTAHENELKNSLTELKGEFKKQSLFLKQLLKTLPTDIYLSDLSIKPIRFYNMNILNRLGYTEKEFENPNELLKVAVHPDDLTEIYKINKEVRQCKESRVFEFIYRVKNKYTNNWHWLHSREIAYQRNENGLISHILGVNYEISDLKKVEKKLKEKNILLENIVSQRTIKLKQTNEDLERYAFIASHDLKEPIRMIISYLQLLRKMGTPYLKPDHLEYLNYAEEGAQRLNNLILNLLNYTRISNEKLQLESINFNDLLEKVLHNLNPLIKEKRAKINFDIFPDIVGNKEQLEQVLHNLISNGLKFQPNSHTPVISITYSSEPDMHLFQIQDNGIGIDSNYHEIIFQAFKRLNSRIHYKGSGVGLSICKRIIQNHSGKIWLKSELRKGTTFYFTISKHLAL